MTPDELLRRYPRETLRWLRGRLAMSQETFARHLAVHMLTVGNWEGGGAPIRRPDHRRRLALLLAPHLATPEGEAFARSLGRDGARGE
jgi:DNA-binding XRE family transcriptional regulator